MKFTIKIGTRNTFFYCDEVSLSRTANPETTLDTDTLTQPVLNGIIRGLATNAITSTLDVQTLKGLTVTKPEALPVLEEIKVEEVAKPAEVEVAVVVETIEEEVSEVAKPAVKRRTPTK